MKLNNSIESYNAVKEYMNLTPTNRNRHQAHTLIAINQKNSFSGVLYIFAELKGDIATIIIELDNNCSYDIPNKFTNKESHFELVRNTLIIKSKNQFGMDVSVDISKPTQF